MRGKKKGDRSLKVHHVLVIILVVVLPAAVPALAQQASVGGNGIRPAQVVALTNKDVLAMNQAGLGPDVIIAKIKSSLCKFDTSPTALEQLRAEKVPNAIILAMVKAPTAKSSAQTSEAQSAGAKGNLQHPSIYLGVYMVNATPPAHGLLIRNVVLDSPAARAGIRHGDILEAVDGQPIASIADYRKMVSPLNPGTRVTLKILRKGRESEVTAASVPLRATVTFVTVKNHRVIHLMPKWAIKWVRKNMKKYPGVIFQTSGAAAGENNYVIAFSFSSNALNGFEPVTHTDTSTSTSDLSGTGTVTDNQGNSWDYTMNGTADTTTNTTTTTNEPYTRTYNTLYLTAYNEKGEVIAQHWHVFTTQQGGNPYNSLGYNLGSALASIHARGHLMQAVFKDINLAK